MKEVKVVKIVSPHEDQAMAPAKEGDIGIDLKAESMNIVGKQTGGLWEAIDYIEYDTGIRFEPLNPNIFSFAIPNSRITKLNLIQGNSVGLIDNGYRGTVRFRFKYIVQPEDIRVMEGNKFAIHINEEKIFRIGQVIGQIIFAEKTPVSLIRGNSVSESIRGDSGFGSTDNSPKI